MKKLLTLTTIICSLPIFATEPVQEKVQRRCATITKHVFPKNTYSEQQTYLHSTIWGKIIQSGIGTINAKTKQQIFIDDCKKHAQENAKIPSHTPNNGKIRIVTWNVHAWKPLEGDYFYTVYNDIKYLNADILILQEAKITPELTKEEIHARFAQLGYTHMTFAYADNDLANIIFSKKSVHPLTSTTQHFTHNRQSIKYSGEKRSYAQVNYRLPNNKTILLLGTHLEVWDKTGKINQQQAEELVERSAQEDNSIIAADFNAVRKKDYQYMVQGKLVWNLLQYEDNARKSPTITKSLDLLEKAGFVDCFTKASFKKPKFTVWSGTTVDFLMLKNWYLPISWCGVMYTTASDHLPVIMDIKI